MNYLKVRTIIVLAPIFDSGFIWSDQSCFSPSLLTFPVSENILFRERVTKRRHQSGASCLTLVREYYLSHSNPSP